MDGVIMTKTFLLVVTFSLSRMLDGIPSSDHLPNQRISIADSLPQASTRPSELYRPSAGFVPDKETAVKIAEAVWLPIYGATVYKEKPFFVELVEDSIWAVSGTLPKGHVGGVAYVEILKRDGRVLGVAHGK
jgi:hypothetical protein